MTATPAITQVRLDRDRDGDWYADSGGTRITAYEGDTVETADLFTIDCPDPLTPARLAAHITACRALLDKVDPTGTNRLPDETCTRALDVDTEATARDLAGRYSKASIEHQLDWAARWPELVDQSSVPVWTRALTIASERAA